MRRRHARTSGSWSTWRTWRTCSASRATSRSRKSSWPRSPGDRRGGRHPVIVLGIDPGTAALGYGVIDRTGARLRAIDHGAFHTPSDLTLPERLLAIHSFLQDLIELHGPKLLGVCLLYTSPSPRD